MNLKELRKVSLDNNIPIMGLDAINYIKELIEVNKLNKILEIGAAVCYSAIEMASVNDKVKVTTIERDAERFMMANKNIKEFNMNDKIDIIFNDAMLVDITSKFNLVVIDAAKGQNERFFEKYKKNLTSTGYIIIDNMNFHGLVGHSDDIESKNLRSLVKKIESFKEYLLTQDDEFKIEYLDLGDGLAVCKRKRS